MFVKLLGEGYDPSNLLSTSGSRAWTPCYFFRTIIFIEGLSSLDVCGCMFAVCFSQTMWVISPCCCLANSHNPFSLFLFFVFVFIFIYVCVYVDE